MQEDLKSVPDNALINYVQNPGEVPAYLALGEIQRRKQMRESYAASQAQAPQSTVAEQMTQQQPEQGVAGLPVRENMYAADSFAQGGIVSFADGGDVGDKSRKYDSKLAQWWYETALPYRDSLLERQKKFAIPTPMSKAEEAERARQEALQQAAQMPTGEGTGIATPTPVPTVQPTAAPSGIAALPVQGAAPAAAPATAPTQAPMGAPSPSAPPLSPFNYTPELLDESIYNDQLKGGAPTQAQIDAQQAERRTQYGVADDPFAGQRAELDKERADMPERKRRSGWEAALAAGLGMMQGKSQYALQNVGAGASVGLEQYKADAKDIRADERAMRKESAEIDRAQQAMKEARMNGDTAAYDKARDRYEGIQAKAQARADANTNTKNAAAAKGAELEYNRDTKLWEVKEEQKGANYRSNVAAKAQENYMDKALLQQRTTLLSTLLREAGDKIVALKDSQLPGKPPSPEMQRALAEYQNLQRELQSVAGVQSQTGGLKQTGDGRFEYVPGQ